MFVQSTPLTSQHSKYSTIINLSFRFDGASIIHWARSAPPTPFLGTLAGDMLRVKDAAAHALHFISQSLAAPMCIRRENATSNDLNPD